MFEIILYSLGFIVLFIATMTDIAWREVPDLLSYGFLSTIIALRLLYFLQSKDTTIILYGTYGFLLCFAIGMIMFYSGQWGGADAKILYGIGVLFGAPFTSLDDPLFIFLGSLLGAGAVYGILYSLYLLMRHWKACKKPLIQLHALYWKLRFGSYGIVGMLFIVGFIQGGVLGLLWALIGLFLLATTYLYITIKVIEETVMVVEVPLSKVTEGDWIAKDVIVDGKKICGPSDLGIEEHQIAQLKRLHMEKVWVKYGIPFIPSFFIAYCVTILINYL